MHLDVIDLLAFYRTPLGVITRQLVRKRLRELWPDVKGARIAGLGFSTPFLRTFLPEPDRLLALMPQGQGVIRWPADGRPSTALVEETSLPMPDASLDRILMVHSLETAEGPSELLREVWRVLAPQGEVLIVVPNRRSLWARFEGTPFGYGRPFSRSQLDRLLRDCEFIPEEWASALHMPPNRGGLMLRMARFWERLGIRWWSRFGGLVVVRATKQIYALPRTGRAVRVRNEPLIAVPGLPQPASRMPK